MFNVLFIVAFVFIIVVSIIVFGLTFFRTAQFSNKIFNAVERELDRHAADSKPPKQVKCEYWGLRRRGPGKMLQLWRPAGVRCHRRPVLTDCTAGRIVCRHW